MLMPPRRTVALSQELIVTACLELVESGGPGALTFRNIGRRLGVDATAVYRHFRDKDDLVRALADRLYEEALAGFAPGEDWLDTLRDAAMRVYRAFAGHPQAAVLAASRSTRREAEINAIEVLLDALRQGGLRTAGGRTVRARSRRPRPGLGGLRGVVRDASAGGARGRRRGAAGLRGAEPGALSAARRVRPPPAARHGPPVRDRAGDLPRRPAHARPRTALRHRARHPRARHAGAHRHGARRPGLSRRVTARRRMSVAGGSVSRRAPLCALLSCRPPAELHLSAAQREKGTTQDRVAG
ncbi:hypothetical protein B1L11_37765 [Microbispora sp. GKU 823]|nr:hypothetical protein B1L11_37765 [Microbispora sp. GKU 823]